MVDVLIGNKLFPKQGVTQHGELKKTETKEAVIADAGKDIIALTGENVSESVIDPKAILSSLKEGKFDSLKDFVSKNSTWGAFIAGITAGLVENSLEQREKVTDYMKELKENIEVRAKFPAKCHQRNRLADLCDKATIAAAVILPFVSLITGMAIFGADTAGSGVPLWLIGTGVTTVGASAGLHAAGKKLENNYPDFKKVKGEKFAPVGDSSDFVTIPPSGNKVLYCSIKRDEITGELYPSVNKTLKLPGKPVSIKSKSLNEAVIKYEEPNLASKLNYSWDCCKHEGRVEVSYTRDLNQNLWEGFEKEAK